MIGYMNGLALTILVGQLPKLFGFSAEGEGCSSGKCPRRRRNASCSDRTLTIAIQLPSRNRT
ncbi:hypothetical protein ACVGVP_25610 [Pseudonocardia artemisiae]